MLGLILGCILGTGVKKFVVIRHVDPERVDGDRREVEYARDSDMTLHAARLGSRKVDVFTPGRAPLQVSTGG
jgi:hypothetical protein